MRPSERPTIVTPPGDPIATWVKTKDWEQFVAYLQQWAGDDPKKQQEAERLLALTR